MLLALESSGEGKSKVAKKASETKELDKQTV